MAVQAKQISGTWWIINTCTQKAEIRGSTDVWNISGPGREYALLTRHHWKHKPWTTRRGDVTFPAVVKSISNRETLYGSG